MKLNETFYRKNICDSKDGYQYIIFNNLIYWSHAEYDFETFRDNSSVIGVKVEDVLYVNNRGLTQDHMVTLGLAMYAPSSILAIFSEVRNEDYLVPV